jgi:hypothetical protein
MWDDLSWLRGFGWPGAIVGGIIVLAIIEAWTRVVMDEGVITSIIRVLRGPRQIITHNICPKCGKIKTTVIDPEE